MVAAHRSFLLTAQETSGGSLGVVSIHLTDVRGKEIHPHKPRYVLAVLLVILIICCVGYSILT